jgi:hypothetical protein
MCELEYVQKCTNLAYCIIIDKRFYHIQSVETYENTNQSPIHRVT